MRSGVRPFLLVLFLAWAATAAAHADIDQSFLLNGALADGGTLTGTVLIDITAGSIVSVDATVSDGGSTFLFDEPPDFSEPAGGPPFDAQYAYFIYRTDDTTTALALDLIFPLPLVGYDGGPLCTTTAPCAGLINESSFDLPAQDYFTTLTATPTPEPSSLVTLLTGLAGVGLWTAGSRYRVSSRSRPS